jgi:glycopeptide antibiotics resistance protein
VISYLRLFSTSFIIALIVWPFLSAALTVPILAFMFHRHHRLRFTAVLVSYVCVLYVVGLLAFTLYPMPDDPAVFCAATHITPQLDPLRFISDIRIGGLNGVLQLMLNVVFFIPWGFMLCRWARWRFRIVVPTGFLVSLFIETSQLTGFWGLYPCAYRQFDVDDLMTNTLGAALGFLLAVLVGRVLPVRTTEGSDINRRPGLLHRSTSLVIDLGFVALVHFSLGLLVMLVFHTAARPLPDGDFLMAGITVGVGLRDAAVRVVGVLSFLVFELWIPATHHGQTLGGMFTHMSVETKRRTGRVRGAFYVARAVALYCLTMLGGTSFERYSLLFALFLAVFWAVRKEMPYDMIAGSQP